MFERLIAFPFLKSSEILAVKIWSVQAGDPTMYRSVPDPAAPLRWTSRFTSWSSNWCLSLWRLCETVGLIYAFYEGLRVAGCGLLDVRLREVKRRCICPFTFLAWCGSTLSRDLTIHHPWTSKCLDSKRWTFFTTCSDGSDMVRFCQILHLISKLV